MMVVFLQSLRIKAACGGKPGGSRQNHVGSQRVQAGDMALGFAAGGHFNAVAVRRERLLPSVYAKFRGESEQ
jgi:hypothetical protein